MKVIFTKGDKIAFGLAVLGIIWGALDMRATALRADPQACEKGIC